MENSGKGGTHAHGSMYVMRERKGVCCVLSNVHIVFRFLQL